MPVPSTMADLSQIAASNSPTGAEAIGNSLDNYIRGVSAIVRSTNAVGSSSITAASTVNLSASDGEVVYVSGIATITSFGTGFVGCKRTALFDNQSLITHSSNIKLPGAISIYTASGQMFTFVCTGANVWELVSTNTGWTTANATDRGLQGVPQILPDANITPLNAKFFQTDGSTANSPVSFMSALHISYDSASAYAAQIGFDVIGSGIYSRNRVGGTWGGWKTLWTSANFTPTNIPTQTGGTSWGSTVVAGATDVSRHIALFGSTYGISVTSGTLNLVAGGAAYNLQAGAMTAPGTISDTDGNVRRVRGSTVNATYSIAASDMNSIIEKSGNVSYVFTLGPGLGQQFDAVTFINSGIAGNITIGRSGTALYQNGVDANIVVGPGSSLTIVRSATANRWIA